VAPTGWPAGEERLLEISALAAGGRGVARENGLVWLVEGGLPGDRVAATPLRRHRSFVEARTVRVVRASPRRRRSPCPVQAECGGCPWMVLEEESQRDWKRRLVEEALRRIGGLETPEVEAVRAVSPALRYRNKVEFGVGIDSAGQVVIGLHSREPSRGLVDVEACAVQHPDADAVLATARAFLKRKRKPRERQESAAGVGLRLVLRRSWATGEMLVVLHETVGRFPHARALARFMTDRHPRVRGVVRVRTASGRRGGGRVEPLSGRTWLPERVSGVELSLPAATFLQVNGPGVGKLVDIVADCAGDVSGARLLDLYGGVGLFAFELIRRGATAAAVCDADPGAVRCGRDAARRAGERRIEHHRGGVARFIDRRATRPAGLILANPPRRGLEEPVTRRLLAAAPDRLLLVSCDPATLARDLRLLGEGFHVERVVPVDLFPQTAHIETVVALRRKAPPRS
jgi:23S rRNA (uracil1939-C5)-methyltransferase